MPFSQLPLEGVLRCDDGGFYYFRQYDRDGAVERFVMYGEHPELDFCRVYSGTLSFGSSAPNVVIQGGWQDVPKGRSCTHGLLSLITEPQPDGTYHLVRDEEADRDRGRLDPFPGSRWQLTTFADVQQVNSSRRRPQYQGDGRINLTGRWISEANGGTYYIGNPNFDDNASRFSRGVDWYGERAIGPLGNRTAWAHVFIGRKQEDGTLVGEFVDVPKGRTRGGGRISATPDRAPDGSISRLVIENADGAPNPREIVPNRVRGIGDAYRVTFEWSEFHLIDNNERRLINRGDEPFFDVFLVTLDGTRVSLGNLATASAGVDSFRTPQLGRNLRAVTVLAPVPEMEPQDLDLRPIEGAPADRIIGGVVITAFERDQRNSITRETTHNAIEDQLTDQLRSGAAPTLENVPDRYVIRFGRLRHDLIGFGSISLSLADLDRIAASSVPEQTTLVFEGAGAHYELVVEIDVEAPLDNACSRRRQSDGSRG